MAVFAIPTGIFGAGFEDMIQHRKNKKEGQTDSDHAESDDDDSAMGYLPSSVASLAGFRGGGGGGDEGPWFSCLDTRTEKGRAYRSLLLVVVVVDVLAFFASTLDSLQVSWCGKSRVLECFAKAVGS